MSEPITTNEHDELPEGTEAPPKGVRLMAWIRWLLVLAMLSVTVLSFAQHYGLFKKSSEAKLYTCPMHPSVVRDQPGQCPICDMSLVPVEKARKGPTSSEKPPQEDGEQAAYYCPMHPDVVSDEPDATCAKCGGMKLVPKPRSNERAQITLTGESSKRMGVKTALATRGTKATDLRVWGVAKESDARVSRVHARTSGFVEQLFVKERAAQVKAGQPLLALFSPELVAAQRELLMTESLQKGSQVSDLSQAAREKLRTLGVTAGDIEAIVREGRAPRTLTIRAPHGGFLSEKPVVQGSYVEAGALLLEITDLSEIWVLASVPESVLPQLALGTLAEVRVPGEQGARKGNLSFIYPTLDATRRTAQLRIRLKNPDLTLRPGMTFEVKFALPARNGLFIPYAAVLDAGERKYVFADRGDGRFVELEIELGARAGELVEVQKGLREGDRVVTSSTFLLDSETRLRSTAEGDEPAWGQARGNEP